MPTLVFFFGVLAAAGGRWGGRSVMPTLVFFFAVLAAAGGRSGGRGVMPTLVFFFAVLAAEEEGCSKVKEDYCPHFPTLKWWTHTSVL